MDSCNLRRGLVQQKGEREKRQRLQITFTSAGQAFFILWFYWLQSCSHGQIASLFNSKRPWSHGYTRMQNKNKTKTNKQTYCTEGRQVRFGYLYHICAVAEQHSSHFYPTWKRLIRIVSHKVRKEIKKPTLWYGQCMSNLSLRVALWPAAMDKWLLNGGRTPSVVCVDFSCKTPDVAYVYISGTVAATPQPVIRMVSLTRRRPGLVWQASLSRMSTRILQWHFNKWIWFQRHWRNYHFLPHWRDAAALLSFLLLCTFSAFFGRGQCKIVVNV